QLRLYQNGSDAAGATIEDKVRDVLNDDNIGPLDLLAGFTNASAITLVAAGLPAQPTAMQMLPIDINPNGVSNNNFVAAHEAAVVAAARAVPVRSDLTGANAPVFVGAPVVAAAQPVANGAAQANVKRAQDAVQETSQAKTPNAQPMASAFPVNIPVLQPGESVTITFQVTVNLNIPNNVTSVSNRGRVTSSSFPNPAVDFVDTENKEGSTVTGGATVTDILPRPTYTINNASVAEPASGSVNMPFTVALSHAYGSPVSVSFSTADGTATAAGGDYTPTSGTLNFAAGQTVQTISVPVLANGDTSDENFTVTLSSPVNSVLGATVTATGTITEANPPGRVLISEVRTSGPGGAGDDFIELYNNQDVSQNISGWAIVKSGASCLSTPVIVAVIPAATTIPARGHYLIVGTAYSLAAAAPGNITAAADIEADHNIGLFNTSNLSNLSTATREDAVGFDINAGGGNNCDLLREGASLLSAGGSASEHSFARILTTGLPKETNDNATDFLLVTTTPAVGVGNNLTPALGAPGPENLAAPIQRNGTIKSSLVDGTVAASAPPNRVRSGIIEPGVPNAFGTLSIQRKFTNTLSVPVTRLRFRIVDLTTINNRPNGHADLRVLSSTGVVRNSAGTIVRTVNGLTLEAPPQPNGGGLNSALTVVLSGGMLAPGNSIEVQFLLGVQEQGNFSFYVNVEALPGPTGAAAPLGGANLKNGSTQKQGSVEETPAEPKQPQQQ
ncbi:MAG TPA: lamin tail domain-containing protein, partial [Pyrinomonadaceae bacterium]